MASAAQRVFDLPELLEHIIVNGEERTVLHAASVSKPFRDVIKRSQKIKKRLWHKSYDTVLAYKLSNQLVPEIYFNELLLDPHEVAEKNPVRPSYLMTGQGSIQLQYAAKFGLENVSQAASCRDMLLFHPPPKLLEIQVSYEPRKEIPEDERLGRKLNNNRYIFEHTLWNDQGVRFGQVLSLIDSLGLASLVDIQCDFRVRFDDEDINQDAYKWNVTFEEEEDVPTRKLIEVSVGDERLGKVDGLVLIRQLRRLT